MEQGISASAPPLQLPTNEFRILPSAVISAGMTRRRPSWRKKLLPTIVVRDRNDAIPIVAALSRRIPPGVDAVLCFDVHAQLQGIVSIEDVESLPRVVEAIASIAHPDERLMIVSNRTGEYSADRWDDEFVWEEMVGVAQASEVVLLDWWATYGTTAFSLAEFAPTPARWDET